MLWTLEKLDIKDGFVSNEVEFYQGLKKIIKSLSIIFSILLTLYIFTYRERKTFSVSLNNTISNRSISFTIILLTIVYGNLYLIQVDEKQVFNSVLLTNRLLIMIVILIISIGVLLSIIKEMLSSINFNYAIKKTIKIVNVLSYIPVLTSITSKSQKDVMDKYVLNHIESFNQIFRYCIDNDLNNYRTLLEHWENILDVYKTGPEKAEDVMNTRTFFLSGNGYGGHVYKSFLNVHISIILYLAEHDRYSHSITCIKLLNQLLAPAKESSELKNIYLSRLHRLFTITNEKYPVLASTVLEQLSKYGSYEKMTQKFISIDIFTDIMTRAVEKNNVSQLSTLAYSMLDAANEKNNNKDVGTSTVLTV